MAVVFIFYGYVTPRKRECVLLRLKQKKLTLKSGSVIVSLSAVAVSHRTSAQAGKFRDREVSMVTRPNRRLSTE